MPGNLKKQDGFQKPTQPGTPIKATMLQWIRDQIFRVQVGRGLTKRVVGETITFGLDKSLLYNSSSKSISLNTPVIGLPYRFRYDGYNMDIIIATIPGLTLATAAGSAFLNNSNDITVNTIAFANSITAHCGTFFNINDSNYTGQDIGVNIYWVRTGGTGLDVSWTCKIGGFNAGDAITKYSGGAAENTVVDSVQSINSIVKTTVFNEAPSFSGSTPTVFWLQINRNGAAVEDTFNDTVYMLFVEVQYSVS